MLDKVVIKNMREEYHMDQRKAIKTKFKDIVDYWAQHQDECGLHDVPDPFLQ